MRKLSELIDEVKFNTNTEKSSKFTDSALVRLFDASQRQIQMVIFNAYPTDPIFADVVTYGSGETKYKLPTTKMLTPNSIHAVMALSDQGNYSDVLPRVGIIERQKTRGYYLLDGYLYPTSTSSGIQLVYAKLLNRLTSVDQVSELPTVCEEYLLQWVEKKINHIISSKDIANSQIFTAQQRKDISDLFADSARDPKLPAILNDEYLAY